jgi:uncharacterized membrane protein (UPF0127 family)
MIPRPVRCAFCVLAACVALCITACDRSASTARNIPPATRPAEVPVVELQRRVTVEIGGKPFELEVAANDDDRQRGLMYRKSMPDDHGMLFVFPDERPLSFWMRNTLIPLDILYLDRSGKVVSVSQMKPLDESGVPSGWPAKYAVELNVGTAQKLGVKAGDVLRIPAEARDTRE